MYTPLRLRHIEIFYSVFKSGSISAAARELNVSQPSVSKVLRHAEDRLGYNLFERHKGRLKATPAALELFEKVEEVYGHVLSLNQMANNIRGRKAGHLRIASLPSLGFNVVPETITSFHAKNDAVTFEVDTIHTREVVGTILDRGCDIAIGYSAPANSRVRAHQLGSGELVLVTSDDRLGPDNQRVDISVVHDRDFIGLRDSGPSGDLLTRRLAQAGVVPREVVIARTYYVALSFVTRGMGVSVIDSFTARHLGDDKINIYRFTDPIRYPVFGLVSEDQENNELIQAFLEHMRDVLAGLSSSPYP